MKAKIKINRIKGEIEKYLQEKINYRNTKVFHEIKVQPNDGLLNVIITTTANIKGQPVPLRIHSSIDEYPYSTLDGKNHADGGFIQRFVDTHIDEVDSRVVVGTLTK